MILELADAGSLEDFIERHRQAGSRVDERTIWKLVVQLLLGLHELKCHEMVHCDLKPSNVLLRGNLQLYLSDLNSCKKSGAHFKLDSQVTPYYARYPLLTSPEAIEGGKVSTAHDLWSLGVIVYQLCTLQHPSNGESIPELFNAIVSKDYKSIPEDYSLNLSQLISSLLRKNVKNRVTLGSRR